MGTLILVFQNTTIINKLCFFVFFFFRNQHGVLARLKGKKAGR